MGWYPGFYNSPEWRGLRERYFRTHKKACRVCGSKKVVELHHLDYSRWGGKEWLRDLMPLCPKHHKGVHLHHNRLKPQGVSLREATHRYVRKRRPK